jgi:hypothetical protein
MSGSVMYGRIEHEWQELEQAGWDFLKAKATERRGAPPLRSPVTGHPSRRGLGRR